MGPVDAEVAAVDPEVAAEPSPDAAAEPPPVSPRYYDIDDISLCAMQRAHRRP